MSSVLPFDSPAAAGEVLSPAAELRRLWRLGQQPRLEAFLAARPPVSPDELAAIVRVDLRQRWRQGARPRASEYLAGLPVLLADDELAIDVIYSEFLAREELGETPQLADFLGPYPEFAEALAAQIRLHRALDVVPPGVAEDEDTVPSLIAPSVTVGAATKGASTGPRPRYAGPNYEILGEIGRGGMGVVYRARQLGLNRLVALKMVRAADGGHPELLARFRAEAEAVARLHHPKIVQIFDYGEHEGLPYLALELVEGGTLAARLDGQPWPVRSAAALVASIARAVHFAHERGVVHRDLKPANILLESHDSEPVVADSPIGNGLTSQPLPDRVKIADFGLAKVFREGNFAHTQTGEILGTPSYMAPEQAGGLNTQIGPATDIHALGAILYELVAGRPAFQGSTVIATLQEVVARDPVPLRRLNPRLPRDLVTICSKCLSKEPRQRYASAGELAKDLERFLGDRPIQARRTSSLERGWRWCRRNPVVATLATCVAVLLLAVAAVSSVSSMRIAAQLEKTKQARGAERDAKQTAELRLWDSYLSEIAARTSTRQIGHRFAALETVERARSLLDQIGRTPDRELQLRSAAIAALALPDLRRLRHIDVPVAQAVDCALSANRFAVATPVGELIVCDLDGRELLRIDHRGAEVQLSISRDGKYLGISDTRGSKLWRINSQQATLVWEESGAMHLALAPDNLHAAVCGADQVMHWLDLESGQKLRLLGRGPAHSDFSFHQASQRIAVVGSDSVQVIDWETGALQAEMPLPTAHLPDVTWHPGGEYLVASGNGDGAVLWHVASGRRVLVYPHSGVMKLSFIGNGDYLLTHNIWDAHLRMWHTGTGREVLSDPTFAHFRGELMPGGQHLLLAKEQGGVALWEVETAAACATLPQRLVPSMKWRYSPSISPDGRVLAIGRWCGLELWDLETLQRAGQLHGGLTFATFTEDGSIVSRTASGVFRWPRHEVPHSSTGAERSLRFGPPERLFGPTMEPKFAMSSDGSALVVRPSTGWRVARPAKPDQPLPIEPDVDPRMVALSCDARWVALGSWNGGGITIFNSDSGERAAHLPTGAHATPLFSPDNRWLATTPDGVRLWNTVTWQPAALVGARGDTASELGIAFSPDSRVLAVSQPTGATRLVDPETGADWAVLTDPGQRAGAYVAFSQDQTRLVTAPIDDGLEVRIWDLAALRQELARRELDWPANVLRPAVVDDTEPGAPLLSASFDVPDTWAKEEAAALLALARPSRNAVRREYLRQVVLLDPACGYAHNELSWLLATGPVELRDPQAALAHVRRALELEPNNRNYLNTLGAALYRLGKWEEAIAVLQRALERSPPDLAAYDLVFLALCHAHLANWPAANDYFVRTTAAIESQRKALSPGRHAELERFLNEAKSIGLPH